MFVNFCAKGHQYIALSGTAHVQEYIRWDLNSEVASNAMRIFMNS